MAALMLGFSATAFAQEAELNAALDAIKSKAPNAAELAKTAYKKNKKNAEALVKIGRAFYEQKDTTNAILFANYANEAGKPKYQYAPAYMLLGDVYNTYGDGADGGRAAGYYNQAINFDPRNPEGYKKYALVYRGLKNPSQAIAKLKEMKIQCPDEDVDAFTGHIYMLAGDEKNAYENYKNSNINKLDKSGLNEFVRCSYFTGHFEDALRAAEAGINLEPRNPVFNRIAMFANYELKKYDAAKSYIHKYFNETDSAKFSEYDHFYTALIYGELGDKANMYTHYDKALELVNDSSMIKRPSILKSVSDSYLKDGEFDNALKYYQEYMTSKGDDLNSDDIEGLAKIYYKNADAVEDAKKPELISKAVEAYRLMGEKFPIQAIYAAYQCATMNNKLDPTMAKSLARPDYLKVVSLLEGKADREKNENTILKYSYHYLMSNAFLISKNKAEAKAYADKILAIDPEYAPAQQIKDLK